MCTVCNATNIRPKPQVPCRVYMLLNNALKPQPLSSRRLRTSSSEGWTTFAGVSFVDMSAGFSVLAPPHPASQCLVPPTPLRLALALAALASNLTSNASQSCRSISSISLRVPMSSATACFAAHSLVSPKGVMKKSWRFNRVLNTAAATNTIPTDAALGQLAICPVRISVPFDAMRLRLLAQIVAILDCRVRKEL